MTEAERQAELSRRQEEARRRRKKKKRTGSSLVSSCFQGKLIIQFDIVVPTDK